MLAPLQPNWSEICTPCNLSVSETCNLGEANEPSVSLYVCEREGHIGAPKN